MNDQWQYQIRIYLDDASAERARRDPHDPTLQPLNEVLCRNDAALKSQYDAFADYLAEAEQNGTEGYPLYRWTKLTLEDPQKRAKHIRSFAIRVRGEEVYPAEVADRLQSDLQPLVGGALVQTMSRHDTNPANNIPVPAHLRT